ERKCFMTGRTKVSLNIIFLSILLDIVLKAKRTVFCSYFKKWAQSLVLEGFKPLFTNTFVYYAGFLRRLLFFSPI
ncbi:hypothetical protein Q7516_01170, partial [Glaesserella parasuis]|nr:hypothetical protein [Glaesserella parasuis]